MNKPYDYTGSYYDRTIAEYQRRIDEQLAKIHAACLDLEQAHREFKAYLHQADGKHTLSYINEYDRRVVRHVTIEEFEDLMTNPEFYNYSESITLDGQPVQV